ncbi:MAG: PKD domain-containing protein [Bacteroidota bacterium]
MIAKVAIRACYLLFLFVFSLSASAQLKTDFSSSPLNGCSPLLVQFTDNSTGNPTQWKWDLGNGTTSFLQNPSVTYFVPGQYSVKLVIRNSAGADSLVKTNYITVFSKPAVDFTSDVITGCYPLSVNFKDLSDAVSGTISTWQWDFGDGTTSDQKSPEHTYTAAGNYNITLRVTNSNGCVTTIAKPAYIKISEGLTAKFTNNAPSTCTLPATINFQNTSVGTSTLTYAWDFGDGTASTDASPIHIFTSIGNYTVKLIATNVSGCTDTTIKTISITDGNVKASFTSTSNIVCLGNSIGINPTSSVLPTSVKWDFGDGTTSTEMVPLKKYAAEGVYRIKMVANFGGCSDSAFKTVAVVGVPVANFSNTTVATCKAPLTIAFKNTSTSTTSYKWYFGDGDSSTLADPSHTYLKNGTYNVTLVASNASGCVNTITKSSLVQIIAPKLKLRNLPDSGCLPFTKAFSYVANEIDIWQNYKWDFGDGATSTLSSPTHEYTTPGIYNVTLSASTAEGCTDTITIKNAVKVSIRPVPAFNSDRDVCAVIPVEFFDLSTGEITKWLWDFGDGSTSKEQNPKHQYSDTGFFDIKLKVWNGGCEDSLRIDSFVHIKAPIAKFTVPVNCTTSFERVFTDKSIGADTWAWDFGDGTTSTEQHPIHTYAAEGTYTVKLVVFNYETGCDYETSQQVQIVNTKANFYASDTVICKNTATVFSIPAENKKFVVKCDWDFGDASYASTNTGDQSHIYKKTGTYTVRLVITNTLGCTDTLTKSQYVTVFGPTAKFTASVAGTCLQKTVAFSDSSFSDNLHPIEKWVWSYGDKKIDTLTSGPFQHSYAATGTYPVTLRTIDSYGCSDLYIIPSSLIISKPKADFVSVDTLSCPGKPIGFTNKSVGTELTYSWNFGDLGTSTTASPSHLYNTDGRYAVKLVATDKYGCKDSMTKPSYINIVLPRANFSMSDSFSTCPPLVVRFTDISTGVVTKRWDFGDSTYSTLNSPSHFYNYPGTYMVKLTITGPGGCTDVKVKPIVIRGPRGAFTYNPLKGCKDLKIDFIATTEDKASFIWDFNDGATVSTQDSVLSHTYKFYGAYVPKLILVDKEGCHVPITGDDTIKVNGALAKFNFTTKPMCDSGMVAFTDSSDSYDKIIKYTWNWGDGLSSNDQNATHHYTKAGTYYPKLTVNTETGCSDSITAATAIKIVASPQIAIKNFNSGCIPLKTGFTGELLAADTSTLKWNWDLGNGNISDLQNPVQQIYPNAGSYTVNLTVTNSTGCFDTATRTVEAYPIPTVDAGEDAWVCIGKNYKMNATGANTYSWKIDNTLSCLDCDQPVATPVNETKYVVTGSSIYGCTASDSVRLKVQKPQKISFSQTDTLCKGEASKMTASGTDNYLWIPAAGLSNANIANPVARPDTTTTYKVIGTDARNCFSDTGVVRIKVYPIPVVNAGDDLTVNIGSRITIKPTISSDITEVIWSPKTWVISSTNDLPDLTVKPKETTKYTIEVKNPGGCKSSDNVTVFVICNGANVFMPNTFSPNGDGSNDVYYPRGTGLFNIKGIRIFSRWGEVVFERNNFKANDVSAAWDGTYKGTKLSPDVFVYTIDIVCDNNEILTFKGNIALIQ